MSRIILLLFMLVSFSYVHGQVTNVVILSKKEASKLEELLSHSLSAKNLYDSISEITTKELNLAPRGVKQIHYEGLLDNNPKRVLTTESLKDMTKLVNIIYASYGGKVPGCEGVAKDITLSWARVYEPTGNTINENKFNPLFWAYYLFKDEFSVSEQELVEGWMVKIARAQINRKYTPNNNWQAKRLRIVGHVGIITNDQEMINFCIDGLKQYINTAYFKDGTSRDLRERDAMHYHVSGIKPLLAMFINFSKFNERIDLYSYVSPTGASIQKSVEYVVPYATGELQRKEWVNTKVQLDKERAAAGLKKYQPGMLFDPTKAIPMFELASYYNSDWYQSILKGSKEEPYSGSWVGLLNSPMVRE